MANFLLWGRWNQSNFAELWLSSVHRFQYHAVNVTSSFEGGKKPLRFKGMGRKYPARDRDEIASNDGWRKPSRVLLSRTWEQKRWMALGDQAPLKSVMWVRTKASHTRLRVAGRGWWRAVASLYRAPGWVMDGVLEGRSCNWFFGSWKQISAGPSLQRTGGLSGCIGAAHAKNECEQCAMPLSLSGELLPLILW